jgi:hypothetical protein
MTFPILVQPIQVYLHDAVTGQKGKGGRETDYQHRLPGGIT